MTDPMSRATNPQMGDDFAAVYEATAHRITGAVSNAALDIVGVGPGTRILDIAAGAGALSGPAAERGAAVLATDIAPGMVRRLAERLRPFHRCEAREMDGQALEVPDASFDTAFSIFGVILFADWRQGLREQARVLRTGGKACVATWGEPPGGGPFIAMSAALRAVFPGVSPPPPPSGMLALCDPDRLSAEMSAAGLGSVQVHQVEGIWRGGVRDVYFEDTEALHGYMQPYAALDEADRGRVRAAIRTFIAERCIGETVELRTPVLVAIGYRI
jgi:ubiquinone/menaquinone biosynthesis C-methylase UbiE